MRLSLRSVEARAFRGVRGSVVLDFTSLPAGLYFVRGRNDAEPRLGSNGAGKSTMFDEALSWVLTGRIARSGRPGSSVESWGVGGTTRGAVVLDLGDRRHEVVRTRRPNGLTIDGRSVEQREVDSLLPVQDAALHRTLLIDQFSEMFLSLRPEDKSRMLSEALDLDRWVRASERAGTRARAHETSVRNTESSVASMRAALAEAVVQYDDGVEAEKEFEAEHGALVARLREESATARAAARAASKATVVARKALPLPDGPDYGPDALSAERRRVRALRVAADGADGAARRAGRDVELAEAEAERYRAATSTRTCPECGQEVAVAHVADKKKAADAVLRGAKGAREEADRARVLAARVAASAEAELDSAERGAREAEARRAPALAEVVRCEEREAQAAREVVRADRAGAEAAARENPHGRRCDVLAARVKELRADIKIMAADLERENAALEHARFWQAGFREIRLEQLDATLAELEMATNRHAEALGLDGWEMHFSTEREKKDGTVQHGFSVSLFPPGRDSPEPWESYSGGESQRWQLAATFGLAEVLLARAGVEPDFEVLDEPTNHLSPEGIDDLLGCLSERAHDLGRRIFVIDHHVLDRGSFDGVIDVIKDEGGTRVESSLPIFAARAAQAQGRSRAMVE